MIVTLTTDFGLQDHFVGVMKGVILIIAPNVNIVDISHAIAPQDIKKAYCIMKETAFFFPANTLHVIVVDPTVGSKRKIIYVEAKQQKFLAPDNGILSFISPSDIDICHRVQCRDYFLADVSSTFHGRDIFSSVAGHVVRGLAPAKLGPQLEIHDIVKIEREQLVVDKNNVKGKVVYIDHFGNLITNIPRSAVPEQPISVAIGSAHLQCLKNHYSEVASGQLLALFNSSQVLEIACNAGNAANFLDIREGCQVVCSW